MASSNSMMVPARRHFRAAEVLYDQNGSGDQPGCKAVSGYLFGIAGELAVKGLMLVSGMRPVDDGNRRDDPFFLHFPALKTHLKMAQGRRASELRRLSEDARLFQNWDVAMRYWETSKILPKWVDEWKESAKRLIEQMESL